MGAENLKELDLQWSDKDKTFNLVKKLDNLTIPDSKTDEITNPKEKEVLNKLENNIKVTNTLWYVIKQIELNNSTHEVNKELQNIWDNYKQKNKWKETDNQVIYNKIEAQKIQIKLIEETYPELSWSKIVSDNLIRTFSEEKWEYVISAEDLKNKLSEQWIEWSSYLETMRYLKWIEHIESNENLTLQLTTIFEDIINWNIEGSKYKNEIALLKKHLPENFLEEGNLKKFAKEFNLKIDEFNIERAYAAENEDKTNEWELEVIIDNLIDNLWEKRAHELMQECVKIWLNRKESIIFLKQYSITLETELEAYKIEHKEYYEAKAQKQNTATSKNSFQETSFTENNNEIKNRTITFSDNGKTETIILSQTEQTIIKWNDKAKENLISFYKTLEKLWLGELWQYREQISNAIWSIQWSSLNYNNDLLWENEIKIFVNSILKSIWKQQIDQNVSLDNFIKWFNSKYRSLWNNDHAFQLWWTDIEEIFYKKYINNGIFLREKFILQIKNN